MAKKNNHPELDKWQKEIERLSFFEENAVNKKLFQYYRQALIEIKKELKVFIDNYENLSFSKRLEAERLLLNGKQIDKILRDMNKEVNNTIEKYVHGQAELGYYGAWYAIEGAHNIQLDMNMLPEKYIKQLVHHPVKGKVFSKRLYKHRDRLAKETTNALLDTARKGKSYAVAAKQINELTEASYKRALRIARTEGGRVQSTAKQRSYVEAKKKGVDLKKKWLSTLDSKTRDTHQGLDGQVVEIEDKFVSPNGHKADGPRLFGVASEDIHCRCTTITEVNGLSPELRKDNLRNEEFPYKTYKEWYNSKKGNANEQQIRYNYLNKDKYEKLVYEGFRLTEQEKLKLYDSKTGYIQTVNSFYINQALRENQLYTLSPESRQTIELMDSKLKEYSLKENVITRRYDDDYLLDSIFQQNNLNDGSLNKDQIFRRLNSGSVTYQNKGYTSVSVISEDNVMDLRPIEVSIQIPKGQNVLVTDNVMESEIILPRGTNYKVISYGSDKDKFKITMEVLTDEG